MRRRSSLLRSCVLGAKARWSFEVSTQRLSRPRSCSRVSQPKGISDRARGDRRCRFSAPHSGLAFEPRDPRRVLELLTLSVGPFRGRVGSQLARAMAKQPGVGEGQEWKRRKARLLEELREEGAKRGA